MLTVLFIVGIIWLVWKLFIVGIKMAWGIAKVLVTVFLLPAVILGLFMIGLVSVAIPALIIVGGIAVVCSLVAT